MAQDDKIRDAAEAVKAIVQAVPVYQDVAQPAAREIGKGLQTIAKTIHIALAPLAVLVWGYEKIGDYLEDALTKRLKDVPRERIVTPQASVAGPTLEALKYAGSNPELRELYANLLARAMDQQTAQTAHPAFVEILRQLTPDEARMLPLLAMHDSLPTVSVRSVHADGMAYDSVLRHFSLLGEQAGCAFPGLVLTYVDNLRRLGLLEYHEDKREAEPGAYEALRAHPVVVEAMKQAAMGEHRSPQIREELLVVTALGRQFCNAVLTPNPA